MPFSLGSYANDSLSPPRYIYMGKELTKLYVAAPYYIRGDSARLSAIKITNPAGIQVKFQMNANDSDLYYINIDMAHVGKFWQLYSESPYYSTLVNTQNTCLFLQPGICGNDVSVSQLSKIDFQIFPNPSTGLCSVKMQAEGAVNINVFNIIGQSGFVRQYSKWNVTEEIDLSSFSTGMYLMKVENKGLFSTKKILILK